MTTAIVKGSLSSVARQNNQSLAQSFLSCDLLVLVDTSGSMEQPDAPGGQFARQSTAELNQLSKTIQHVLTA